MINDVLMYSLVVIVVASMVAALFFAATAFIVEQKINTLEEGAYVPVFNVFSNCSQLLFSGNLIDATRISKLNGGSKIREVSKPESIFLNR